MSSVAFCFLFCFLLICACGTEILVETQYGTVAGSQDDGVNKFLSIPYAASPSDSLRWQPPQPVKPWAPETYNATQFRAACPQPQYPPDSDPFITVPITEDCLQLNIYTPEHPTSSQLPVMVYIHGGSFYSGWGGDPIFYGDFFANQTDSTILVTINYRLGALGFLVTPEITGNFGFMDQQMALKWVQQNIGAFGGDPQQVTIFGQSAGGMSVTLHLLSPSSFGLYNRSISESNPMGINYRTPEESYSYANKLASNLNCNASDISCLMNQSWEDIVNAQEATRTFFYPLNTTVVMTFYPTIDGTLIPDQPIEMIKNGKVNPNVESVAFGCNRNDSMTFIPNGFISKTEYDALVEVFFGPVNSVKVLQQYPPVQGQDNSNLLTIVGTDWLFACPNRLAARMFSESTSAYLYHFLHVPSDDPLNHNHLGCVNAVCHSDELYYVFHSSGFVNATYTTNENELSLNMLRYWSNYAHGILKPSDTSLPTWPLYSTSSNESISFDIPISTQTNYHQKKCDFWDSLGYKN